MHAWPARPDVSWSFFVGPSYLKVSRGPTTITITSLIPVSGVKFRVCRKTTNGKLTCGSETKEYRR
ncbi:hypothetical protein [Kribbella solani]|uniref:Uncharacterized protein n=1 Tax=Kribbella solani TaxID=236067 RepID=A0A841E122_9ACTN|nr:hypothetical protein [Kribbella solani]MBB5982705.1 hypothetical protein [Kribbella solani]